MTAPLLQLIYNLAEYAGACKHWFDVCNGSQLMCHVAILSGHPKHNSNRANAIVVFSIVLLVIVGSSNNPSSSSMTQTLIPVNWRLCRPRIPGTLAAFWACYHHMLYLFFIFGARTSWWVGTHTVVWTGLYLSILVVGSPGWFSWRYCISERVFPEQGDVLRWRLWSKLVDYFGASLLL